MNTTLPVAGSYGCWEQVTIWRGCPVKKHFYKESRDFKTKGEEFDRHPKVKWWVRNVDRQAGSFWLPRANGHKFYPDFVAELTDGRMMVVEHKGEHLETADDAKEKNAIGKLWAEKSCAQGVFNMVTRGETIL